MLVPKNFNPPLLKKNNYLARKLQASDVYLDYIAVMSSIDAIHATRGGKWPTPDLTFEDDLIDLSWHQREFEFKSSFAYTVMNKDETECLGCIYFYPPEEDPSGSKEQDSPEVEISWWVTQKMLDKGFYEQLSFDIKEWVENEWPFKNVAYVNKKLPNGFLE
jgi:RimJ/RimL family protein N-acetyltransferase